MPSKKPDKFIGKKTSRKLINNRLHMGNRKDDVIFPVAPATSSVPASYASLLSALKERIRSERLRVVLASNTALVSLYWDIGMSILKKQRIEGWGAKVIDRLSVDLVKEFPDMAGFSPRNLKYMRSFAAAWADRAFVQRVIAQIPWRSNIALLDKLENSEERLWYAQNIIKHGWSQPVLCIQIENRVHERTGKAVNNFPAALPPADSDMARQIFKDPYLFDFLGTADTRREKEIKLKAGKLEPGHVSQLNMYMNVVDDVLRHSDDKPTIGLLLVKQKNKMLAEYALRGYVKPISIAQWKTQITRTLPEALKSSLPTIKEIETELGRKADS